MEQNTNTKLFIQDDPKSIATEAFRLLRTNLQFAGVDRRLRRINITSCNPGEGKTTVTANLAASLASAGVRVLLIDADLRKPRIHKIFSLDNQKGLSNLLAENLALEEVIKTTDIQNFDMITSGPIPPNPAEILSSDKMKNFIEQIISQYDMVLLDCPPVLSLADASILSSYTDGVILVVESGSTEREALITAHQQLQKVNAKILGVVLNKIRKSSQGYYHYYYYGNQRSKRKIRIGGK
jgi:protein-tyrosine kinase